ncbi:MAG: lipocalin family protein [Gammaproteobacteria bacterium]
MGNVARVGVRGAVGVACVGLLSVMAGCASFMGLGSAPKPGPLKTVPQVDLTRYMGDWFVIANIPYSLEKNCHDSVESYALRVDGRIANRFQCREKSFQAPLTSKAETVITVYDKSSNAEWRVPFYRVLSVKYLIIDLDSNYEWAVIGHPSRRYGWIIARSRTLPEATYQGIRQRLGDQGYDVSRFAKVPQRSSAGL